MGRTPVIGERRRSPGAGLHVLEDEYQPTATRLPSGLVTWGLGNLGRPLGDGWVRIYGEGLNYGYQALRARDVQK